MGMTLQLARFLAAVVAVAAFLMPSIASAHEGHAHHKPATTQASAPSSNSTTSRSTVVAQPAQKVASLPFHPNGAAVPTDCGSHCCGGAAGMACCGAVMAVTWSADPFVRVSELFLIPHIRPTAGLPPETLPRPPKSFG